CEGRLRAEVGHGQRRLEGPARREDLAPDGVDGRSLERARAGLAQAPEDLGLPLRGIDRRILPSFEVSDLEGGLAALVEELKNSVVEIVDPGTPIVQVHRDSHYCRALGVGRIIGRPLAQSKSAPGSSIRLGLSARGLDGEAQGAHLLRSQRTRFSRPQGAERDGTEGGAPELQPAAPARGARAPPTPLSAASPPPGGRPPRPRPPPPPPGGGAPAGARAAPSS